MKYLYTYYQYLSKYLIPIILVLVLSLLYSFLSFGSPFIVQQIYDKLIASDDKELLFFILFSLASITFLYIVTSILIEILLMYLQGRLVQSIRIDLFYKLLSFGYSYYQKNNSGEIAQRLIPEIDTIGNMLSMSVKGCGYLLQIVSTLLLITLLNYQFIPIFITLILSYAVFYLLINRLVTVSNENVHKSVGLTYSFYFDFLKTIKVVKLFNVYCVKNKKLQNVLWRFKINSLKYNFFKAIQLQGSKLLDFAVLIIIFVSFKLISKNQMTIGEYIVFSILIFVLMHPVIFITEMGAMFQNAIIAAKRIRSLLNGTTEKSGCIEFKEFNKEIEFRNVAFSYSSEKSILSAINFKILKGTTNYIIGKSGSGKSTLINLLCRIYDPTNGMILIDGINSNKLNLKSLRSRIAVLSQDTFIFNESIKYNVDPHCIHSDEKIVSFLKSVELNKFLNDITYTVGEKGSRLSGGERQRLALARLLARRFDIVILDESTSNVDPITEKKIYDTLYNVKTLNENITFIIITHNFRMIHDEDVLFLIDHGKIVKSGYKKDITL